MINKNFEGCVDTKHGIVSMLNDNLNDFEFRIDPDDLSDKQHRLVSSKQDMGCAGRITFPVRDFCNDVCASAHIGWRCDREGYHFRGRLDFHLTPAPQGV